MSRERHLPGEPGTQLEATLRDHFRSRDPGVAPLGMLGRIHAIPDSTQQVTPTSFLRLVRPYVALAAAATIVALVVRLVPTSGLLDLGSGGTPPSPTTFDPTLDGIGLAPAFDQSPPWFLTVVAAVLLAVWAVGSRGWRRLPPLAAALAVSGYAAYGTFVPISLTVSGFGPGLNVSEVQLPPAAPGNLYDETAPPRQPFAFGILLGSDSMVPFRIESLTDEHAGQPDWIALRWTSLWLDEQPNGGMTGPNRPFEPLDMPQTVQSVWLVGRAGACAMGHVPVSGDGTTGDIVVDSVKFNVSVLGWPRVIDVAIPRIAEPDRNCSPDLLESPSPSGVGPSSDSTSP